MLPGVRGGDAGRGAVVSGWLWGTLPSEVEPDLCRACGGWGCAECEGTGWQPWTAEDWARDDAAAETLAGLVGPFAWEPQPAPAATGEEVDW